MVKIVIDPNCLNQGGSTYDDTEVLNRIKALEGRTDNFVKDVTVSRDGDKVKFTYTRVDGSSSEVEFDDKDTISVAYDDTALKARVTALEGKEDSDKQTLTLTGNELFISNGNSVTLPVLQCIEDLSLTGLRSWKVSMMHQFHLELHLLTQVQLV